MILQWNDVQLATGDAVLDEQHKELFRRVNKLHDAVISGQGDDESRQLLDYLANYVTEHFAHEEGLMACHSCPVAPANKEAHAQFVQQLLAAKRDLLLPQLLRKLDRFDVIVLDDLGYVQQSADDAEVLFTLMAERYERRSLVVTSNLVFSKWDRIFGNPMATAAAIDRVVHHSVILEFDVSSKRAEDAAQAAAAVQPDTEERA